MGDPDKKQNSPSYRLLLAAAAWLVKDGKLTLAEIEKALKNPRRE